MLWPSSLTHPFQVVVAELTQYGLESQFDTWVPEQDFNLISPLPLCPILLSNEVEGEVLLFLLAPVLH